MNTTQSISQNIEENLSKKSVSLTATYKIITPMFIGDAEQKASWISPMSFKGALRFWWRAIAWGRIRSDKKYPSDELALKRLHDEEAKLFGDTEQGCGLVSIKITQPKIQTLSDWPPNNPNSSSAYLAYGLTGDNQNAHRQAIKEGESFDARLIINNKVIKNNEQFNALKQELETVLTILGLCGGLGSRSRRANGAIQLTMLNGNLYKISDKNDYLKKVEGILSKYNNTELAPYTAFSWDSLFSVGDKTSANARHAHANLGADYKTYRGQPSELRGAKKKVFGLPLKGADETARRASPLFFHIVEFEGGEFGYSVLYIPTSFFHKNSEHQAVDYRLTKNFVEYVGG